jgi:hypothetical protein
MQLSFQSHFRAVTWISHLHVGGDSICDDSRIRIRVDDTDCRDVGDVTLLDQCQILRRVEDNNDIWEMRGRSDRLGSEAIVPGCFILASAIDF